MGADPLASAVSTLSFVAGRPLPAFYVRKEAKGHGTGPWIEGTKSLRPGMPVAILEDVVTTGGSALKAIARVREHGLVVAIILGLVDREEGGREVLEKEAPLVTLFRRRDFSMTRWGRGRGRGRPMGAALVLAVAVSVVCSSAPAARRRSRCASTSPRRRATTSPRTTSGSTSAGRATSFAEDDVDKALEVWATFKSWDFREAYIEKLRRRSTASRTPSGRRCARPSRRPTARRTSSTSRRRARTTSGTISRRRARPGESTLLDALGHELPSEWVQDREAARRLRARRSFPRRRRSRRRTAIRFVVPGPGVDFAGTKSGALTLRFASPIGRVELVWKS